MVYRKEIEIGGRTLSIEVGKLARQAHGSAWVRYGDTIVFAAVVAENQTTNDQDFLPLSVDYRERTAAAGKIPGGFFKREGRPSEKEILSARLIDRPLRPLFPEWFKSETQIMVTVLSADAENDGDILGAIAASAALAVSDLPLLSPIAEVTVGRLDGKFIINPTFAQLETSDLKIVVAGTSDSIVMVEGESSEIPESVLLGAINFAHSYIKSIISVIEDLVKEINPQKRQQPVQEDLSPFKLKIQELAKVKVEDAYQIVEKVEREETLLSIKEETLATFKDENEDKLAALSEILHSLEREVMRRNILEQNHRLDGRGPQEIRPISCEVGLLPRAHGSSLFSRGQTQALATATLGTRDDEQRIDSLEGDFSKRFLLHYNFPGFSTGEITKRMGVSRREVGHGNLAERALKPMLPAYDDFPYTIRIVSDILESNGSSSMATVCAGCLALMDAGVPIRKPVAGVAMGLIMEGEKAIILTDILGAEDHLGDMDFKVAGTREGITAIQMDIKIKGISAELLKQALDQAHQARLKILDKMTETIAEPRPELSPFAPRIIFMQIDVDKIGLVIGPGGKTIREIIEKTGTIINIEDDGTIQIASTDQAGALEARKIIAGMTEEPEVGKIYEGTVKKITDFGAFVEILPGREGLLHISNIEHYRVEHPSQILKVGDKVTVKLLELDSQGKMDLSRKALLEKPAGFYKSSYRGDVGGGRDAKSGPKSTGPRKPDNRFPRK